MQNTDVTFTTSSPEETEALGEKIGRRLQRGDILTFKGELGAGKTCMIRGIAKGLGIKDRITSSSFVIMRVMEGDIPVYHFDLYRLENEEELIDIGYDEFLFSNGVSLIEWPEKLENLIGSDFLSVEIQYDEQDESFLRRIIKITPSGKRFEDLIKEII